MDLELLKIPPKKIGQLKKKGFETLEDLAAFYPRRYDDFRTTVRVADMPAHEGDVVAVIGTIKAVKSGPKAIHATIEDKYGDTMSIVWFNQRYIVSRLFVGVEYVFCGKVYKDLYKNHYTYSIKAPMYFSDDPNDFERISPVYSKIAGMSSEYLESCVHKAVALILNDEDSHDYLDKEALEKFGVPDYKKFLTMAHAPTSDKDLKLVERRKACDDLFPFVMKLTEEKYESSATSKFKTKKLDVMRKFIASLPFPLTKDQDAAITLLAGKMKSGERADALVQGDVGCGKTVIATALAVAVAENGYQAAIMCPTAVLAEQHYKTMSEQLKPFNIRVALLVSGLKAKEKRELLANIADGNYDIVVGTHAVISKDVQFANLALTVVDEEHRFGVEQRDALKLKARNGVHNISMTATPIPRTIAKAVYGDNTIVVNVHTMPSGRKPVRTVVYGNEEKTYMSMAKQIRDGHQCYVVCPLIEDSDNDAMADVESVEMTYKKMTAWFTRFPTVKICMITGNMKPAEIAENITDFAAGKYHILISTTIIEVGVNVPNATVMVVKNAERFGLSQLHQLRGRVGRGNAQSYCVLLSKNLENPRLQAMAGTTDGFEIAKRDLELRGTGDIVGVRQSGIDKSITLMLEFSELYAIISKEVDSMYQAKCRADKYRATIGKGGSI